MGVDPDAKLTGLAAEILRDALPVYGLSEGERLLVGFNPVLATTGAFPAVTGALPTLTPATQPPTDAAVTSAFKALTGSFRAITESFRAIGQGRAEPTVTLGRAFRLPGRLPGVRLAPEPELGAMARSAPTMAELGTLARWLGRDGRRVTATGELTGTDATDTALQLGILPMSLSLLWEYALTSGWFELAGSGDRRQARAVIGETASRWADGDDQGALHVWAAVFAAVTARALEVMAATAPKAARGLSFQGQGVALVVMLFLSRRAGVTMRDAEDFVREKVIGDRPASRVKRAWDAWARQYGDPAHNLLAELAGLKAVTLPRAGGEVVELTPLALWALREQFLLDRISVPVLPAPSPQMSAAALVALADAVGGAEFDTAFTIWIRGHDPDQAVRELLIYAGSSDPHGRLIAVDAARRVGVPAYRAWKDAMKRPELRGYARITLTMMASELPESTLPLVLEPDPADMTWLATDLLAVACGADDPDPDEIAAQFAVAVPAGEEGWIFGLMAQGTHPDVGRVLQVLSAYHPDHQIAKGARKALRALTKNRRLASGQRARARAVGR